MSVFSNGLRENFCDLVIVAAWRGVFGFTHSIKEERMWELFIHNLKSWRKMAQNSSITSKYQIEKLHSTCRNVRNITEVVTITFEMYKLEFIKYKWVT